MSWQEQLGGTPMIRSNNAHCTKLQTGAILGLWQAGLIQNWGMSSQNWNWTWDQQLFMPQPCFLVEDWLTREPIEVKAKAFWVRVPPASFRILRVRAP